MLEKLDKLAKQAGGRRGRTHDREVHSQERNQREELKAKVRKLAEEGLSHERIAARLTLACDRFPPGVTWAGTDWSEALKANRGAVSKWLSTAIHGR